MLVSQEGGGEPGAVPALGSHCLLDGREMTRRAGPHGCSASSSALCLRGSFVFFCEGF